MFEILDAVLERAQARGGPMWKCSASVPPRTASRSTARRSSSSRPRSAAAWACACSPAEPWVTRTPQTSATARSTTSCSAPWTTPPSATRTSSPPCRSPAASRPTCTRYDPRLEAATDEQRIAVALEVEATALAADPRVKTVEDTMYVDGDGEVFIASTAGVRGSFRADQCYAFAYVLAEAGGPGRDRLLLQRRSRRGGPRRGRSSAREAAGRATRLLGAKKCPSMKAPVILDPFVSAAFFGVLSSALTADAVQKGRSLFAGREGERVAGELLELVDDGTLEDGLDSAPFDGEGVPVRAHAADHGRRAPGLPLRHVHGAQGRPREHRQRHARRLLEPARRAPEQPRRHRAGDAARRHRRRHGAWRPRHRRRRHPLRRQPDLRRVLRRHQRRPHRERQVHARRCARSPWPATSSACSPASARSATTPAGCRAAASTRRPSSSTGWPSAAPDRPTRSSRRCRGTPAIQSA